MVQETLVELAGSERAGRIRLTFAKDSTGAGGRRDRRGGGQADRPLSVRASVP